MPKILIKSGANAPTNLQVSDSELAFNRTKGSIYVGKGSAPGEAATSVIEMELADHVHGNITRGGNIGSTAGLVVKTGASGLVGTLAMGTAGQVLKVNSGATDIEWGSAGGTGTVTSVGLSLDANLFTAESDTITGSGSLDVTLSNRNANLVFAGPNTGSAAKPSFRALVSADLPTIDGGTY